jgi:phosphoribosylanthranilate isomerase
MRTRIKVCCIRDEREARLAIELGADALGLVGAMPSGPGPISDGEIAAIARAVPPPVATFLLTSRTAPDELVEHVATCRPSVVQLVDEVPIATYEALRERCAGVRIVQVVHVEDGAALELAREAARHADAVLLDSGSPGEAVKQLGGTGRTHDWELSREIVRSSSVPVFLAGGLDASNVGEALARVSPFAVDLCSGVRTGGALDAGKLRAFVAAVRGADGAASSG